jgi:hypothetical protein
VKSPQLSECPEFEVDEVPVSEGFAYYRPQRIVEAFHKPVCNSFYEVIEYFIPPVA